MDAFDTNTHHLFFDDCASYVVDARDVNDPETPIKFDNIEGIHAVHVNSYAVMSDDNYFIDHFYNAENKFTERKQKWRQSHWYWIAVIGHWNALMKVTLNVA